MGEKLKGLKRKIKRREQIKVGLIIYTPAINIYAKILEGSHGVMVIIVRSEHSYPSSNPGQDCLHFT